MYFIYYLAIVNAISFLFCFLDKIFAVRGMYRIPEFILLFFSFFGGCFAFLLGMYFFHHKTKKFKFKVVYLFCLIWLVIIYKIYF